MAEATVLPNVEIQPERQPGDERSTAVGAAWHTVMVIAAVLLWGYFGARRFRMLRSAGDVHLGGLYARSIAMEWAALGLVLWGVKLHGTPLREVVGARWASAREALRDAGRALLFWLGSIVVLGIVGVLLHSVAHTRAVHTFLPHRPLERLLWVAVAISAGICEEAIFRGYLQRQFLALTKSVPLAIVLNAGIFGFVHLYQGWRGMILVGLLGALLGILAQWRGTVRTGMIAHAWQDIVAGLLGGMLRH